ncbi:la-related protein 7 [Chelonus insularis]|uniref:la-related protein 7 n=1 Tax=Chelonus insularis TaxID=460826 RepID=UPI001589D824|nr:la-related protein 7 [Chelonus insularis]
MVMEEQENSSGLASESIPVPRVHDSMIETQEALVNQNEERRRKPRLRKKALHAVIRKQMEFYFSDANLSKDRFLANLIQEDSYVDLDTFLQFNKIRALTNETSRIAKALESSEFLALSDDRSKVRRITPINIREDCDVCTIYVQGLPPDADHDWLISIFSQFGPVAYVSIPRYKTNKKIKGFAFIEFESSEDADKCLEAFQDKGCVLPSYTAPESLLSITTFSEDDPPSGLDNMNLGSEPIAQDVKISKRPPPVESESELEQDVSKVKKPRINGSDNRNVDQDKGTAENNDTSDKTGDEVETEDNDKVDEKDEQKKKKKRKRKNRARNEQPDITEYRLRIMAKKEWKKIRNKYLQLQRNKMKQLKQHLKKTRWNQWNSYDRRENKMEVDDNIKKEEQNPQISKPPKFTFAEGLITKIELDEPCSSAKSFKNELRNEPGVQYIDVRDGYTCAYVRCDTAEASENFVKKYADDKTVNILQGEEEKAYWDKMMKDREEKLTKKDRVKQRGRDKLLKKAEKELGKHIKFDEVS